MTQKLAQPIDISTLSLTDLLGVVREVYATKESRVLQLDSESVAMLTPIPAVKRHTNRTSSPEAVLEAIHATAGVWKGLVDGEQFKGEIKEARGD
jgi:hypothetical protein